MVRLCDVWYTYIRRWEERGAVQQRYMDEMVIMYILTGALAVMIIVLALRLNQYKRQIRSFTRAAEKRRDADWNRPVTVDYFNKDILELADVLNRYTDMQKEIALQYANDRRQLKNVIAGISHDFRTPLTAANGYLQLLAKRGNLSEQDKEYLDIAIKKITYLKLLSDDFFEVSSLEAKEEELEISRINVGNFLSECILQQYGWIEQQKLQTDFQLPEEDVFLETNEHYLRRMIENLFSNTRKYVRSYVGMKVICEKGQLVIVLENDLKEIDIVDTNQVFEPFYRGSARSNEGSGLGLYVVKCLAKQLGYGVSAECQDGLFRIKVMMKIR